MPAALYSNITGWVSANSDISTVLATYPLATTDLTFLLDATGTWFLGERPSSVTINISVATSRTITVGVYDSRQISDWPLDSGRLLGSATITSTGSISEVIPLTFGAYDLGTISIAFSATGYVDDITLDSIVLDSIVAPSSSYLYKLSNSAQQWIEKLVWVQEGEWVPDPPEPPNSGVPNDPIGGGDSPSYGWISSDGGASSTYGPIPDGHEPHVLLIEADIDPLHPELGTGIEAFIYYSPP